MKKNIDVKEYCKVLALLKAEAYLCTSIVNNDIGNKQFASSNNQDLTNVLFELSKFKLEVTDIKNKMKEQSIIFVEDIDESWILDNF